jgi:hypothetical protein
MGDRVDEVRFRELLVESDDLQSDAMKGAHRDLDAYVEAAQEARSEYTSTRDGRRDLAIGGAALAAGAIGVASLAFAGPAFAATIDVQALQTAAGIENLAVLTYKTALTMDFIGGGSANPVVKAFAMKTMSQHKEHGAAFNAAATKLGGTAQTATDPTYTPVVMKAVPKIKGAGDVVSLAITLEDIAAQTYTKDVGLVSTADLRQLFASVAGVESQHRAILLAVQALLAGNLASQIKLPPDALKLPAAAGSVGFPSSFYATSMAAPVTEGAVK